MIGREGIPSGQGLLPREHGAYAMLLFPIASALALQGAGWASGALALAFVLGFISHRALLQLAVTHEVPRARPAALRALVALGIGSALLAAAGLARATPAAWVAVLIPGAGLATLCRMSMRHAAHGAPSEALAAVALSTCALPVALASSPSTPESLTLGLVWPLGFLATSLAVRAVIERQRPERASRFARRTALVGAAALALLATLAAASLIPRAAPLALVPLVSVALGLAFHPPSPKRMRTIGWALVIACALTLSQLLVILR